MLLAWDRNCAVIEVLKHQTVTLDRVQKHSRQGVPFVCMMTGLQVMTKLCHCYPCWIPKYDVARQTKQACTANGFQASPSSHCTPEGLRLKKALQCKPLLSYGRDTIDAGPTETFDIPLMSE